MPNQYVKNYAFWIIIFHRLFAEPISNFLSSLYFINPVRLDFMISDEDKIMMETLYWWGIPTLFRCKNDPDPKKL